MYPPNTILRVRTGSHAYGTATAASDDDESLVYVEPAIDVLGVHGDTRIKHRHDDEMDRQEYPLRQFLRLAAHGNPSVLEMFWCPPLEVTEGGWQLIKLRQELIGRHIIPRYRGFIRSQTMRLLGLKGQLRVTREHLRSRDGYDTKYAMHCVRLGMMCVELLETRDLVLPMLESKELHFLKMVREGRISFQEWWDVTLRYDERLAALETDESIPERPNLDAIEAASVGIHLSSWLT